MRVAFASTRRCSARRWRERSDVYMSLRDRPLGSYVLRGKFDPRSSMLNASRTRSIMRGLASARLPRSASLKLHPSSFTSRANARNLSATAGRTGASPAAGGSTAATIAGVKFSRRAPPGRSSVAGAAAVTGAAAAAAAAAAASSTATTTRCACAALALAGAAAAAASGADDDDDAESEA